METNRKPDWVKESKPIGTPIETDEKKPESASEYKKPDWVKESKPIGTPIETDKK